MLIFFKTAQNITYVLSRFHRPYVVQQLTSKARLFNVKFLLDMHQSNKTLKYVFKYKYNTTM